jgi:hypothetical protein
LPARTESSRVANQFAFVALLLDQALMMFDLS